MDLNQLHRCAARAELLAERARESLQRTLRRRRSRAARLLRGQRKDDHAPAPRKSCDGRMEEAMELDELSRVGDPGRVEDEALPCRALRALVGLAGLRARGPLRAGRQRARRQRQ